MPGRAGAIARARRASFSPRPAFCDPALLERPMLQEVLAANGMPFTAFKYAENTGQMRPSASRPAPSPTPSSYGVHDDHDRQLKPTAKPPAKRPEVMKEDAMKLQKELIAGTTKSSRPRRRTAKKVSATFVPGNLNELLMCFDFVRTLPEINALQNGMRKKSGAHHGGREARPLARTSAPTSRPTSACSSSGDIGPTGEPLPEPDVLLLSYTGCFTFMKWFELLRQKYKLRDGDAPRALPRRRASSRRTCASYVVKQLEEKVIPKLERVSGVKFDIDRLRGYMERIGEGRGGFRLGAAEREEPALADRRLLRRRLLHRPDLHRLPRHARRRPSTTACCAPRSRSASRMKQGPVTPEGELTERERYRLVVEGPPNWTSFREFWKMFYDEGAVVVASTYTKVGGNLRPGLPPRPRPPAGDRSPSIASAVTPTSTCPRASACSRDT